MRKFLCFILALVLALGCCSAFAATTEARSDSVNIHVNKYALAIGVNDDLVLWDETGTSAATITVNGNGETEITTTVLLKVGNETKKEVSGTTVTVDDIYAAGKSTTEQFVIVQIWTSESKITKNTVTSDPIEAEVAEVLVMNNIAGDDPQKDKPGDKDDHDKYTTKGLLVATTTVNLKEVWPGDKLTVTGTTDVTKLNDKLDGKAIATVRSTDVYYSVDGIHIVSFATSDKESATNTITIPDGYGEYDTMVFWTIGTAVITETK